MLGAEVRRIATYSQAEQRRRRRICRNPIGIVVPCHRVVGANGKLTGYAGGLPRKQVLLDLERGQAAV